MIEEYPYQFHFVWVNSKRIEHYKHFYEVTNMDESKEIFAWLKENVIDENWCEFSNGNDDGLIETYVYFKEKNDAMRFRLVWGAKIK